MPKVTLPFGEWRPDLALLDNQFASEVENVFPGINSYKPMPSLLPFTTSLLSTVGAGNDSFTKILLHMDGADASTTFTDSNAGGSAHTFTAAGNAQIDTADSKFGGASGLFDGTGDWISTPDHADYTLGSGDFTIDGWIKPNATGQLNLAGQCDSAGTFPNMAWIILRNPSNHLNLQVSDGSAITGVTGSASVVTGSWYHFAAVRSGNSLLLFVNGILDGTTAFSGTVHDSANNLRIGAAGEVTTSTWNGWIDEFRLSVGVARWTANFTPPNSPYFSATGAVCGLTAARTSAGDWKIYAGTQKRLFIFDRVNWIDVSRTAGGDYNVPTGSLWTFKQFGTFLYACSGVNDVLQRIDVEAGVNFAAVAGSPPQARSVTGIGDFLVLVGLSSNPRKIRWSSINDPTAWTVGINLCDEQEFPDGGPVKSVEGDTIGYVVQDRCIRSMQFLPNDTTLIFTFNKVLKDRGGISDYGAVTVGDVLYFISEDGFYALVGTQVFPIGQDKINEWWFANSDISRRSLIQAVAAHKPYVLFAYHSSSAAPTYDKILVYDWSIQRWGKASISAVIWGLLASTGIDLDTTTTEAGDDLLDSGALSLDSFSYLGGRPLIAAFDANGLLSTLTGPNLRATMETVEAHIVPGMRAYVSDAYPLVDSAGGALVSAATRERLQDHVVWGAETPLEVTGSASVFSSGRLQRFRVTTPAGDVWTHAQGVLVEADPDGVA